MAVNKRVLIRLTMMAVVYGCFLFGGIWSYERPPAGKNVAVYHPSDSDYTYPQQIHISMVGEDKMRISWITDSSTPAVVTYRTSADALESSVKGSAYTYSYLLYRSGEIHDVIIGPLKPDTVYHYRLGSDTSGPQYSFKTPPPRLPIKFVVIGDLGQTDWTKSTLQHIGETNYDVLLLPGDLSYADFYQPLWDSFGRLVEPLARQKPWMVTQGNHEIEKIPIVHGKSFTAYNARWRMPFDHVDSASTSNLYYSFNVANGAVHIIFLGSYTDFNPDSDQYNWLQSDLAKIDRSKTPWVVVLVHAPWYNSNTAHQGESESEDMKKFMEEIIYKARVDVVFAGHVHAYERFTRVYEGKADECGPVYITIGDGGNREGLSSKYIDPKPEISLFREASFGHGQFEVVNATHARWSWHRNDDAVSAMADSQWLTSLSSNPACKL